MPRWMGVDINGWRDAAARDWDVEDLDLKIDPMSLEGGVEGVSVLSSAGRWVGGPQALLAPHGRGDGWGEVGRPERRKSVVEALHALLEEKEDATPALRASVGALTRGAQSLMVTVPDVPEFDERAQGLLLGALRGRGRPRSVLLWRSVALFLHALEIGVIPMQPVGCKVNLLVHTRRGLELQSLTLAAADGFSEHHAPVRKGFGEIILPELGLAALSRKVEALVIAANPFLADRRCEATRLPARLLCESGFEAKSEILRRDNGTWAQASSEPINGDQVIQSPISSFDAPPADLTLLASPLSPALTAVLERRLAAHFQKLHVLPWSSVALGALAAGRLIERGLPHYLDQLEPISLAILGRERAAFEYLVPPNSNVPANREFVSEPMTDFAWAADRERIEFYVLKGSTEIGEVRHWTMDERSPPGADTPVTIQLCQMPGQSWARLEVTSPDWPDLARSPIRLDWETLKPDPRSVQEILETLQRPRPVVPNRIVELPNIGFWDGSLGEPGLLAVMNRNHRQLLEVLIRSQRAYSLDSQPTLRRIRPVGTDGDLPVELSDKQRDMFIETLHYLANELSTELGVGRGVNENIGYRCLTWAFTACPLEIQDITLDALDAQNREVYHPLLNLRAANTVLQQGAGRSIDGAERIKRLLRILTDRQNKNAHTWAAYSFILSRREVAPLALDSELVEKIALQLVKRLNDSARRRNFATLYKYLIGVTAGLLRFREVEPWALLVDRSATATMLHHALLCCRNQLVGQAKEILQGPAKLAVTESLIEMLAGSGGDPDLLIRIEEL